MHRSARGETDETRDVHARQGLRDRSRGGDESDAGLARWLTSVKLAGKPFVITEYSNK
jgi:hypothetical protein